MNGKITLPIVENANEIRGIPGMNAKHIRIIRLSGDVMNDRTLNIAVKNMINQHHFQSAVPLAMYNPIQGKDPLFVAGSGSDISMLLKELRRKAPELITDDKVRIDHPENNRDRADLLNLYLKYLATFMFDTQHVSITADRGLTFLQNKGKTGGIMVSVYFREKDGDLLLCTSSVNVYRVKETDSRAYDYTFSRVGNEFGAFQLKTFDESAGVQRYRRKKQEYGIVKSTHLAFTGDGEEDEQWEDYLKGASVGACVAQVVKMLRNAGLEIHFQEVDSISCGFGYKADKDWQKAEIARSQKVMARRIRESGLWVRRTSSISDEQFEAFFHAVKEAFSSRLSCVLFTDSMDKDKSKGQEVNIRFGPIPEGLLSAYGMVTRANPFQLPESNGCFKNAEKSRRKNEDIAEYRNIKEVELRCIPGTGHIHLPVKVEGTLSFGVTVHDIDGVPSGDWDREAFDHVTDAEGRYELILQKDESDEQYEPALNRQYITLSSVQDADPRAISNVLRTSIRELLCVKGDLLEGRAESTDRDLKGTSFYWHRHSQYGRAWDRKITIGENNEILKAPLTDEEALISSAQEDWAVLTLSDGRIFRIHHAKEMRQIIAPVKDEKAGLSKAFKGVDTDYVRNIHGNTGFQHFDFEGKQYYLIGFDDSQGLRKTYSFYPSIYEVSREDGDQITERDWYDLVSLCYTPLVSSQRNASVYPFMKKYIDEQIRVTSEYLEAKKEDTSAVEV